MINFHNYILYWCSNVDWYSSFIIVLRSLRSLQWGAWCVWGEVRWEVRWGEVPGGCEVRWGAMRWGEVRRGEVRWGAWWVWSEDRCDEVRWGEARRGEVRCLVGVKWGAMRCDEVRRGEARWVEARWGEMCVVLQMADAQQEHQREMEGLLENVRQLSRELKLQMLIIDDFIPPEFQVPFPPLPCAPCAGRRWETPHSDLRVVDTGPLL